MSITFLPKKPAKPAAPAVPAVDPEHPVVKAIQRMAEIEKELRASKPLAKEYAEKLEIVKAAAEVAAADADKAVAVRGVTHEVEFTAKNKSRSADVKKAKKLMGDKLFMEVAKIGLAEIDKYLTPAQIKDCVTEGRDGARSHTLRPL